MTYSVEKYDVGRVRFTKMAMLDLILILCWYGGFLCSSGHVKSDIILHLNGMTLLN